jgi:ligand-binding sensor domain-containing protein
MLISQYSGIVHYTVKDGLPSSTTYSVVQDNKGFIWIGTEAGLVRYDGTNFKVYTTQDGLPDNEVLGLLFDNVTNRMWIVTYRKAACYYYDGAIYTAQNEPSLNNITCDFGEFIGGNSQPGVGVFLYNGFSIYKCANRKIFKTRRENLESVLQVKQWEDESMDLIFRKGVCRYRNDSVFYYKNDDIDSLNERGKWIGSKLFLFRDNGVIQVYNHAGDKYLPAGRIQPDIEKNVLDILLSKSKYIFCIPGTGVYEIDTSLIYSPRKIWSGSANGIFSDGNDNVWISTADDGVFIIKNMNARNYNDVNGLVHDNVTTLYKEANGQLYIGNSYGEVFCLKNEKIEKLNINIGNERIRGISTYRDNIYLIANGDITVFDTLTKHISTTAHISGGPKTILKLRDNTKIFVGLSATIVEFDLQKNTDREIIFHKRVIDMSEHPDGRVFCGSLDGIYQLSNDSMYHIDAADRRLQSRVTSMCFTSDSILWFGTPSDGIMAFDGRRIVGQINASRYMSYHGSICRKVIAGGHCELWVATNSGINNIRYHVQDSISIDNITPLNTLDGLLSDDVNDIILNDSLIYVATSHGLTVLNLKQLSKPVKAPIYISSFRVNEKDSAIHESAYSLLYWQNNLRIEYVGILLPVAGDIRYQYRLLGGGSDKWETTTNTSIEFRSLSPGVYTFEVAVLDKFGNRSGHSAFVKFHIWPAFYQTVWFWAIVIILILGTGFYLIRSRFRREQAINTKIIDLEQQALKAQMNPHFIFNCLTAIQHFVNKEDVYSANMYLSNFAKLIRKTLDLSGEQYITLDKEVAYLENYIQLEKMRFQEQFNYKICVDEEIDVFSVQIPPMLLQPIIENAIRHGLRYKENNEGMLNINFSNENNNVVCRIDDNGIGIRRSRELKTNTHVEYQSKGMKLTESRIAAINMISVRKIYMRIEDKYDEQGNAIGTLVIINFEQ